ncbi:hypothetical protein O181_060913 [Austropuccinia psidii MF-1]|uniref:Uncharacterized protein n=1 Tax=Austropuccinia psidii MF-1 TaxID=1389203 RepID=A0A9Q3HXZ3_9BASI|nr:hypothetical protein [Austropuccinia psidii MF-1]
MGCNSWSTVRRPIRPLLAYSNEVKRGQRGQPSSPQGQVGAKPQLDPSEPILGTNALDPNLTKKPFGHQFGHKSHSTHFWTWNTMDHYSNHQRPPDQFNKLFPQLKGNSFSPPCTLYSRLQEWCIYGIIYHYAPFLLSKSKVTFSGPNSTIPTQVPKIQRPFRSRIFQLISLAIRRPFKAPIHPALQELGWKFHSELLQGH